MSNIVVLVKEPIIGQVKTRLGKEIGMQAAAQVHRILSKQTFAIACSTGLRVECSFLGDLQGSFAQEIRRMDVQLFAQPPGTLGDKLHHAMNRRERTVALGIDCPSFPPFLMVVTITVQRVLF